MNIRIKQSYFPSGIDRYNILLSEEALYSVSHWRDAFNLVSNIKSLFDVNTKISVIDGTACVGGNVVQFALHLEKIIAVDILPEHIHMLKYNLDLYKMKNKVTCIVGDITQLMPKLAENLKNSILFLDPPWGGPEYKSNERINLYLSQKSIDILIIEWINYVDFIIIKVPNNFNTENFTQIMKNNHCGVKIWTLLKYSCLVVNKLKN